MRRLFTMAAACLIAASTATHAGTFTFQPTPADLYDLDHYKYYTWGFDFAVPAGETITEGELTIKNINNWKYEPNANWLYMHLLDDAPLGVVTKTDNEANNDAFAGQGKLIDVYTDNSTAKTSLSYKMSDLGLLADLNNYAADGRLGLGFDPDCHYFNDGIKFIITTKPGPTTPVPEPMTMVLSAMGLSSIVGLKRLRKS